MRGCVLVKFRALEDLKKKIPFQDIQYIIPFSTAAAGRIGWVLLFFGWAGFECNAPRYLCVFFLSVFAILRCGGLNYLCKNSPAFKHTIDLNGGKAVLPFDRSTKAFSMLVESFAEVSMKNMFSFAANAFPSSTVMHRC